MLIYIGIAVFTVVYSVYYYITRTFNYWKDRNVAGPTPMALFGNLKDSTMRKKPIGIVHKELYEQFPNEKIVGIFRMTTPCLLIRDLDLIKHVMIKDFDMFMDRGLEFGKDGLGSNIFNADGDTWQVLRSKFTPLFTSGKLKNMLYLMNERGDKFIEYVNGTCLDGSDQAIHQIVQKFTVSNISACAFGLDIDLQNDKLAELKMINDLVFKVNHFIELDMMFPGLLKKLNTSFFPKIVTKFFYDLVRTVISQRNGKPTDRKDFMDLILELKQQGDIQGLKRGGGSEKINLEFSEDIIAAQAFVFYVAGYETSASTMAFMLYSLAKYPEIQEKVIAEIDEVLERHGGEITYEGLKEMTYMTQVFDETLRMYPLVEPLQRNATVDYKVPGTNVVVKKGQMVLVSPLGVHHDSRHYPNPEKFDPDRFSPENSRDRHPCAYMPFGVGPRNCIGMRFAKVQSKVCIAKMLSHFRVEPCKGTQKFMEYDPYKPLLSPLGGIYLNIVARRK